MEMQAEAERKKRAQVLESEGNEASLICHVVSCGYINVLNLKGVVIIYGLFDSSVNLIELSTFHYSSR